MGTVPANFHGKPGRSGRKTMRVEKAKTEAIRKAWLKVEAELDNKDVEKVALPIALKDMVAKIGNPDGSNITPIQIYAGRSIQRYPSNSKDIQPDQEDQGGSRGDISEQND